MAVTCQGRKKAVVYIAMPVIGSRNDLVQQNTKYDLKNAVSALKSCRYSRQRRRLKWVEHSPRRAMNETRELSVTCPMLGLALLP